MNEFDDHLDADATARETDGRGFATPAEDAKRTREQWLKDRESGIGSSDAAAAIGVCPWKSRFQLWAEKTGLADPPNLDAVEAVEWGNRLEPIITRAFSEHTLRDVTHNEEHEMWRHPDRQFLRATPDAFQFDDDKADQRGILEIKTAGHWAGKSWIDENEPPLHYQVQVQHQLACTGLTWGTLCVLIGGQKMIWFDVQRNDRFIDAMIEKEAFFWTQVINKIPPEPDGSIATTEVLKRLYPKDDGEIIALHESLVQWDEKLQAAKVTIKEAEAIKSEAQNKLKAAIGTATVGVLPDGSQYSYKRQTTKRPARPASESSYRVLRRKAAK